jgi:hypothetical protein
VAQQEALSIEATGVSGEVATRSNDAVARHDDREWVAPNCSTNGTDRLWSANALGDRAVGCGLTVGNLE